MIHDPRFILVTGIPQISVRSNSFSLRTCVLRLYHHVYYWIRSFSFCPLLHNRGGFRPLGRLVSELFPYFVLPGTPLDVR